MRKNPRFLFWVIVVFTILAILIDLPRSFHIYFSFPKVPFVKKQIRIDKQLNGLPQTFLIGPFRFNKDLSFRKGLDLEGGTSITLKADMSSVPSSQKNAALDSVKAVIEKRINFLGVSEPVVQTAQSKDDYRIIVEIPGVSDVQQAVQLVGTTAQLSFWEQGSTESGKLASPSAYPYGIVQVLGAGAKKTNLTGKDLQQTAVTFDQSTGSPQVQLVFSSEGAKKFGDITKKNVGKPLAIVLDNQVIEAPRVNQAIYGGNAVITGSFSTDQANILSTQLNAGALPVPLSVLAQHTVGATLGDTSLQKSVFAGVLGFIIVIIFMSALYGSLGILASLSLLLYTLFVLAIFKFIPVTITLAGIAGFILSIGMAVDANILIFERTKEELRRGKPKDIAIELGFSRAWSSIRDSNISSIITSFILFQFGTGIVRGFALTLMIGVIVSMFSAILVTRTFLRILYIKK